MDDSGRAITGDDEDAMARQRRGPSPSNGQSETGGWALSLTGHRHLEAQGAPGSTVTRMAKKLLLAEHVAITRSLP